MGQSYDSNGVYIGWSNLFDYSTTNTLQASKELPVPKRILIQQKQDGVQLDSEINQLLPLLDYKNLDEKSKVKALKLYSQILKKAEQNKGNIYYSGTDIRYQELLNQLNNHEFYSIPINVAEAAYKNVASSNIYLVSHDIRNRDQAYTAISMDIMKKGANKSPKGNEAAKLNMLNPLTKYIMQYQNLVGKNVISIGANGEKVWFNTFYHWNQVLKYGTQQEIDRLKFQHTFYRINGRAKGTPYEYTVSHLPDLNPYDNIIRAKLLEEFGATEDSLKYKYVDQLISQLLSAATDNAKELILAKINAGTNFARMYVYTMMMGLNINDIVAFMTSPVVEFIDQLSTPNIFQNENVFSSAAQAINASNGIIGISRFLHGTILSETIDSDTGEPIYKPIAKSTYVSRAILNSDDELVQAMIETMSDNSKEQFTEDSFKNLQQVMQALILTSIKNNKYKNLDITTLFEVEDAEINSYLVYCQNIIEKLRDIKEDYLNKAIKRGEPKSYDAYQELQDDVKEFKKLYQLSSEITQVASGWLGLNQGLPTDELGIIRRLMTMSKIVSDREEALGIKASNLYGESETINYSENKEKLIERLLENNPTLTNVEYRLDSANEARLINNFDVIQYLNNTDNYRDKIRDYYNLIMGTINIFDMVEINPNYKQIVECLKALVVSNNNLSYKSRLINKIIKDNKIESVQDNTIKGIIQYVNKMNTIKFTSDLVPILVNENIEGFDPYFRKIQTNKIELNSINGLATFKHWIENEFLNWLKEEYNNPKSKLYKNSSIKHFRIIPNNDGSLLSTDVDLLNPNITTVSREGFDEILRGFADLEKVPYDESYSVVDLLQLYNIVVNDNMYGGERLTTAFKVCTSPDNILNKYLDFISKLDWNDYNQLDYDIIDYQINSAPIIKPYAENRHGDKFVKVMDPVQGFILKKLDKNNKYNEYNIIPASRTKETYDDRLKRLENFMLNSPIVMPHYHNIQFLANIIDFKEDFENLSPDEQNEIRNSIKDILIDYSTSNKVLIFKDC